MNVIKAPSTAVGTPPAVFLAGPVGEGPVSWHDDMAKALTGVPGTIFDPRRGNDVEWTQSREDPVFREQRRWELRHMTAATIVAVYLPEGEFAPITLMELGVCLGRAHVYREWGWHNAAPRLAVCCPKGFYRRGYVETTCEFFQAPMFVEDFDEFTALVKVWALTWETVRKGTWGEDWR